MKEWGGKEDYEGTILKDMQWTRMALGREWGTIEEIFAQI